MIEDALRCVRSHLGRSHWRLDRFAFSEELSIVLTAHLISGKSNSSSINTSTEVLISLAYRRSTGNGGSRVPLSKVDMSSRGILSATPSL